MMVVVRRRDNVGENAVRIMGNVRERPTGGRERRGTEVDSRDDGRKDGFLRNKVRDWLRHAWNAEHKRLLVWRIGFRALELRSLMSADLVACAE